MFLPTNEGASKEACTVFQGEFNEPFSAYARFLDQDPKPMLSLFAVEFYTDILVIYEIKTKNPNSHYFGSYDPLYTLNILEMVHVSIEWFLTIKCDPRTQM